MILQKLSKLVTNGVDLAKFVGKMLEGWQNFIFEEKYFQ